MFQTFIMGESNDYPTMQGLVDQITQEMGRLENGTLKSEEIAGLIQHVRELEERLIILRYKAMEDIVKPETPVTVQPEPAPVEKEYMPEVEPEKVKVAEPQSIATDITFNLENRQTASKPTAAPMEMDPEEVVDENQTSLLDAIEEIRSSGPVTLNDKLKENARTTLASKLQKRRIKDLTKVIGLNQQFGFIRELFEGDSESFHQTLNQVNNLQSLDEAMAFLQENVPQFEQWDREKKMVQQFFDIIERRFK